MAEKKDKKKSGKKKKSRKLLFALLGSLPSILPALIVVMLPMLAFGLLSAAISGFSDWASMWGSTYKLEDFTHYVDSESVSDSNYSGDASDETYSLVSEGDTLNAPTYTEDPNGTYSLMHYPTETDFVDIAIKAEIKQLSRNIYKNLTFDDAVEAFDAVYLTKLESLANDFKSTYMTDGSSIVTNSSYASLYDSSGNFDKDNARALLKEYTNSSKGLTGSMWTKSQIKDEYLGVNSYDTSSGTSTKVRDTFKNKSAAYKESDSDSTSEEGLTKENDINVASYQLADYLAQWMYASMKVDSNRFVTDAEQAEMYGSADDEEDDDDTDDAGNDQAHASGGYSTLSGSDSYLNGFTGTNNSDTDETDDEDGDSETIYFRETCADKDESPLYYYSRKKTDGDTSGSTESEQKGGDNKTRLEEVKSMALEMSKYLAMGTSSVVSANFLSKIDTDLVGNYFDGSNQGAFLSYEVLDPDEVDPIAYDPITMADIANIVGLGTISSIYGEVEDNYLWYTVSCEGSLADTSGGDSVPVAQKMEINTSGFYIYTTSSLYSGYGSKSYNIAYAGKNYDASKNSSAEDYYGYGDFDNCTKFQFTVKADGTVSNSSTLLSNIKSAVKSEFDKKKEELLDNSTVAGQLLVEENARRGRLVDAITAKYEDELTGIIPALERERDQKVAEVDQAIENAKAGYEAMKAEYDAAKAEKDALQAELDELKTSYTNGYNTYLSYLNKLLVCNGGTSSNTVKTAYQGECYVRVGGWLTCNYQDNLFTVAGYHWYWDIENKFLKDGNGSAAGEHFASEYGPTYMLGDWTRDDDAVSAGLKLKANLAINTYIEQYYNVVNQYNLKAEEMKALNTTVSQKYSGMTTAKNSWETLEKNRDKNIAAAKKPYDTYQKTDKSIPYQKELEQKEKDAVTNADYTVLLQTRVAWYLGDESTLDIPVFGNGLQYQDADGTSQFIDMLRDYSSSFSVSGQYANIKGKVIMKYGTIDTGGTTSVWAKQGMITVNENTCHFVISYDAADGSRHYAAMNHLICYRILYTGMKDDGGESVGAMHAPATANNRYNFSTLRTSDGTSLLYEAEAKPATNEETLQAAVDMMDDIDESLTATEEPTATENTSQTIMTDSGYSFNYDADNPENVGDSVGDTMITDTESLREMLTETTWTKRDRNWRKSFMIRMPDDDDTYYNEELQTEMPYWDQ